MSSRHSPTLTVMVQAARKAARTLSRDFGEVENLQVSVKGPGDFVSAADLRAEETLREELTRARPGYGFLLEESGTIEGTDKSHRWIIDPLDGTTNFLHGIPLFAINIALEREGEIIAGLTYNPISDELFWAEKGKGAFVNDKRLRVAARRDLSQAVVCTGIPHIGGKSHAVFSQELATIMPQVAGVRRTGSCAIDMAFVAAGRFDAYWERGLNAWDLAAGIILVREAGGTITDLNNKSDVLGNGSVLATNEALHRPLMSIIKKAGSA
ncbi:inositol monophosphatase family protein [Parvibaculaceae bacterium PLY_AMNH_Bact1]|nr:inositol monophosphatase family protein [Parvibaculaceae bacterium PLY_AMNH_Bact1]